MQSDRRAPRITSSRPSDAILKTSRPLIEFATLERGGRAKFRRAYVPNVDVVNAVGRPASRKPKPVRRRVWHAAAAAPPPICRRVSNTT